MDIAGLIRRLQAVEPKTTEVKVVMHMLDRTYIVSGIEWVDAGDELWLEGQQPGVEIIKKLPRAICVDGTDDGNNLAGNCFTGPFYVFDSELQQHVAGPYGSRWRAKIAVRSYKRSVGLCL